ncbi:uncharacterized protein FIBRA_09241 [Fibroporia radiculosa]|uniref:Uncharacterized protein n=1 Tax=Fibroporia radiculosa TaxID=599839 RepID=J7S662_9APHY|nr:uncharacterized protein FIBRA_09241 [Fibroporia radiculosa]CCM06929.1 predicted protein [Fibroporia radiculosa]
MPSAVNVASDVLTILYYCMIVPSSQHRGSQLFILIQKDGTLQFMFVISL